MNQPSARLNLEEHMMKYWKVEVPAGHWATGIHRFGSKRQADEFVTFWLSTFAEADPTTRLLISNDTPRRRGSKP